MRRTLLTVLTFAVCATGVGYAAADLMPNPGSSTTPAQRAAAVETLAAPERGLEPIARPAMPQPATETTAPAVPNLEPAPATGAAPSSTVTPRAVEAPAPAAVNPQPVPVAAPTSSPEPTVAEQNPDEVIGRQIDGPNGERCVVVDAELNVTCEPTP